MVKFEDNTNHTWISKYLRREAIRNLEGGGMFAVKDKECIQLSIPSFGNQNKESFLVD